MDKQGCYEEKTAFCPNCPEELTTKPVEKLLKGGVYSAIVQVVAELCLCHLPKFLVRHLSPETD